MIGILTILEMTSDNNNNNEDLQEELSFELGGALLGIINPIYHAIALHCGFARGQRGSQNDVMDALQGADAAALDTSGQSTGSASNKV